MAKFVYAMNLSLDGYVDHGDFGPDRLLFRHWIEQVRNSAGAVYGSTIYGLMRYWEEDRPEWGADEREFADAWRAQHKWVMSRSLTEVGPDATLVSDDAATVATRLKSELRGEVDVSGTKLAHSLTRAGLIDEYRLYYHPVVLGKGTPFFAGAVPRLRLISSDRIGPDVIRLNYVPAGRDL